MPEAIHWLLGPFAHDFMQHAAISCLALGIAAPIAGIWATHRRMVYLTDAMSHAVLAGVAAASLLGGSLLLGGLASAAVMAVVVALLVARSRLAEDSAIGIAGQGLFALGVIGVSLGSDPRALSHALFGNPLTVTPTDLALQAGLAALVLGTVVLFLPVLTATTFDSGHARSLGVNTTVLDVGLVLALGLVVVVGMTTVGVLMVVVLCIAPAAGAGLVARTLAGTLAAAVGLGTAASLGGLLAAYHLALPAGPVIAVAAVLLVAACALPRLALRRTRPAPEGALA